MREKNQQTFWNNHLKKYPPVVAEVYELKMTKGNRIPYAAVKPHQREALMKCKYSGFVWKITDQPVFFGKQTRFHTKKPFDSFFLKSMGAYVVVWFYVPRTKKVFIKIDIMKFIDMERNSTFKSFTLKEAIRYGTSVYL